MYATRSINPTNVVHDALSEHANICFSCLGPFLRNYRRFEVVAVRPGLSSFFWIDNHGSAAVVWRSTLGPTDGVFCGDSGNTSLWRPPFRK